MTKKRVKKAHEADVISDLPGAAERLGLPEGSFDGDVEDECIGQARGRLRALNDGGLRGQLEFLLGAGYSAERLRDLMRYYAEGGG
jgi:hypothetical protein